MNERVYKPMGGERALRLASDEEVGMGGQS